MTGSIVYLPTPRPKGEERCLLWILLAGSLFHDHFHALLKISGNNLAVGPVGDAEDDGDRRGPSLLREDPYPPGPPLFSG